MPPVRAISPVPSSSARAAPPAPRPRPRPWLTTSRAALEQLSNKRALPFLSKRVPDPADVAWRPRLNNVAGTDAIRPCSASPTASNAHGDSGGHAAGHTAAGRLGRAPAPTRDLAVLDCHRRTTRAGDDATSGEPNPNPNPDPDPNPNPNLSPNPSPSPNPIPIPIPIPNPNQVSSAGCARSSRSRRSTRPTSTSTRRTPSAPSARVAAA